LSKSWARTRKFLYLTKPESFAQEVLNTLAPMPPAKGLTVKSLNALGATRGGPP